MRWFLAPCTFFFLSYFCYAQGIPPIGQWREHLPYNNAINIIPVEEKIYCATPYALFSYDTGEKSFERLSKVNGLSEVGVSRMKYDASAQKFIIAYQNSNIDVLYRNSVINVPDIKLSNVSGDKSIYNIYCFNNRAYLSTGLGIIVINQDKYEVAETYLIGNGGGRIRANDFTQASGFFYAATVEGLKRAAVNSPNLSDFNEWQTISGSNGLSAGEYHKVFNVQDKVLVQKNDSLFIQNGSNWIFFYHDTWSIVNIDFSENKILLSETKGSQARMVVLNTSGTTEKVLQNPLLSLPRQAIIYESEYWIADQNNGLFKTDGNSTERVFPNSPINIATGDLVFSGSDLWAAAGSVSESWTYLFNPNGIYRFSGDFWTGVNQYIYPQLDTLLDFITIAIDRQNEKVYAGSYGGGLLEINKDNSFKIYKQNSPLQSALGDPGSYRVSGLATDAENNLWISNYGAPKNLLVKKADGNWQAFSIPFLHNENAVSQIVVDDYNQKWIVSPGANGLFCLDHGNSIDNFNDDRWKFFRKGKGNGNLPSEEVFCIAKDKDGFIWIGTGNGIGIVQCPQEVFANNSCEAFLPIVQQDNFAGFLFQDEEIRSIAVDGANRKWVGTKNGVWLISPEGDKVIYRFTEDNSPLLSNDVRRIAVNPQNGEVFIATFKGMCSFRGTATEGENTNSNSVLVFPNPVPPGYNGTIAIRGLVNNAWVKITELNGRLVYQTRALGGQAVWNGRDYKGNKAASGVYLVLAADELNREKVAAKIFFIK
jgi:hypothetical protein